MTLRCHVKSGWFDSRHGNGGPMNCAMCGGWMGGAMVIGGVIALLIVVLLVIVIAKAIRS